MSFGLRYFIHNILTWSILLHLLQCRVVLWSCPKFQSASLVKCEVSSVFQDLLKALLSISRYCIQIQVGMYILYADYRVRLADVIKRWMAIIWEIRPCIVISFSNYSTAGLVYSMYHHYRPYVIGTFIKGPWKINVLTQYSILVLLPSQHQYYNFFREINFTKNFVKLISRKKHITDLNAKKVLFCLKVMLWIEFYLKGYY